MVERIKTKNLRESSLSFQTERHGYPNPLDQSGYDEIQGISNLTYYTGERARRKNRMYTTIIEIDGCGKEIAKNAGYENYEAFVDAHVTAAGRLITEAVPEFEGFEIRRFVNIREDVRATPSYHLGYLDDGFADSNGLIGVTIDKNYKDPKESAYWDEELKIDWGWVHEFIHRNAHLGDTYALNWFFNSALRSTNLPASHLDMVKGNTRLEQILGQAGVTIDQVLDDRGVDLKRYRVANNNLILSSALNEKWNSYMIADRNDRGPGIMNGGTSSRRLAPLAAGLMRRRLAKGNLHDDAKRIPEGNWSFPNFTEEVQMNFRGWGDANVEVYRTYGDPLNKKLKLIDQGLKTDSLGDVRIDPYYGVELDSHGLIPNYEGIVVVRVTRNGKSGIRILDPEDFYQTEDNPNHARMSMDLITKEDDPDSFDWTINYTGEMKHQVFIPIVMR